jgi:benzoyl-CoA reductase subunit C
LGETEAIELSITEIITRLNTEITDYTGVKKWQEQTGGQAVGWLPPDVPVEIIAAFGLLPVAILGSQAEVKMASAHLPNYVCSYMRSSLDLVLQDKLNFLAGLIFPQGCDAKKHITDLFERNSQWTFLHRQLLPKQLDRPSSRVYFAQEIRRLISELKRFSGVDPTEEDYRMAVTGYNLNRGLLRQIVEIQQKKRTLSNEQFFAIVKSALLLPVAQCNVYLAEIIDAVSAESADETKIPLVLSGTIVESWELLRTLDEFGLTIVGDDLYAGYRYYNQDLLLDEGIRDPEERIVAAVVKRHYGQIPYSNYFAKDLDKKAFILDLAARTGARGVVFALLKFCDAVDYDYPLIKEALAEQKIPSIKLEIEFQSAASGQLKTRLQAFAEIIRGRGNGI